MLLFIFFEVFEFGLKSSFLSGEVQLLSSCCFPVSWWHLFLVCKCHRVASFFSYFCHVHSKKKWVGIGSPWGLWEHLKCNFRERASIYIQGGLRALGLFLSLSKLQKHEEFPEDPDTSDTLQSLYCNTRIKLGPECEASLASSQAVFRLPTAWIRVAHRAFLCVSIVKIVETVKKKNLKY